MKIIDVKFTPIFCAFKEPYVWADGIHYGAPIILIEIKTDANITGISEACVGFFPVETILSTLKTASKIFIGQPIHNISNLMNQIYTKNLANRFGSMPSPRFASHAFAGLELALWDALGKTLNLPVHQLLGGAVHNHTTYFGFLQGHTTKELTTHATSLVKKGFPVIYLKLRGEREVDLKNTAAVRKAIGDVRLRLDPNESWDMLEAEIMIKKLLTFNPEMIEQPIPARCGANSLKALRQNVEVPLAADQAVYTPNEVQSMCASGAVSLIVVSLHETGGILGFKKAAAIAEVFNINICIHGVFETGITTCASIQAAATTNNIDDGNQIMWQLLSEDIVEQPNLTPKNGKLEVSDKPGLGFTLNHDAVGRAAEVYKSTDC